MTFETLKVFPKMFLGVHCLGGTQSRVQVDSVASHHASWLKLERGDVSGSFRILSLLCGSHPQENPRGKRRKLRKKK
jgi:hypothetical protein